MLRTSPARLILFLVTATLAIAASACSNGKPTTDSLRASFAQQLVANRFISAVQQEGDDVRFSGPGADGEESVAWRVHIDEAVVEESRDALRLYRGVVKSSWFSNGHVVTPSGGDSHLPLPLTSNGLAQECFALWDAAQARWSWE